MPGCKEIQTSENEMQLLLTGEAVPSCGEETAVLQRMPSPGPFLSQLQQIKIPSSILHIPHVFYLTKSI